MKRQNIFYILVSIKRFVYLLFLPTIRMLLAKQFFIIPEMIASTVVLALSIAEWACFKYEFSDEVLHIRHGILLKRELFIPISSLSEVAFDEGIVNSFFGAVKTTFNTPSRISGHDAVLYISRRKRKEFMVGISNVHRISNKKILLSSFFNSNALLGLLIIIPFITQIGKLLGERIQNNIINGLTFGQEYLVTFFPPVYAFIIWITAISFFISFLFSLIRNANFRIAVDNNRFIVSKGLIFNHTSIFYTQMMSNITVRDTFAMRLFKLYELRAGTFGSVKKRGERSILIPAESYPELKLLIHQAGNSLPSGNIQGIRAGRKSKIRFYKNSILIFILFLSLAIIPGLIIPSLSKLFIIIFAYPVYKTFTAVMMSGVRWKYGMFSDDPLYAVHVKGSTIDRIILNSEFFCGYKAKFPYLSRKKGYFTLKIKTGGMTTEKIKLKYLELKR